MIPGIREALVSNPGRNVWDDDEVVAGHARQESFKSRKERLGLETRTEV